MPYRNNSARPFLILDACYTASLLLLLRALHAALDAFHFTLQVLAFEQGHIELAKAVIELETKKLRIPSPDDFLVERKR